MNDKQKQIIREEFARATMIKQAQSVLSESAFRGFMYELKSYEQSRLINENIESELLYEGFLDRLKNLAKGAIRKLAPDKQEKIDDLAHELDYLMRGTLAAAKETGDKPGEAAAMSKARDIIRQVKEIDPMAAEQMRNAFSIEMGDESTSASSGGAAEAPEEPSGNVRTDVQNLGKEIESPKAKGILASIYDSYKFAFASNAKFWERVYDLINGVTAMPQAQQGTEVQRIVGELPPPEEVPETDEDGEGEGDEEGEGGESINIRKGKNSLQSRLAKLFPDLAKAKGTYYYRKTDKPGDQGRIISKNTSALAAILGDIEAQLKGSDIAITESLRAELAETICALYLASQNEVLLEKMDPNSQKQLKDWRRYLQVGLQRVKSITDNPKKKRKLIQQFLYRLKRMAKDGDFSELGNKKEYQGRTTVEYSGKLFPIGTPMKNMGILHAKMNDETKELANKKADDYATNQINQQEKRDDPNNPEFKATTLGNALKDAPTKTRHQMAQQVPKIKNGVINIAQIIGPKLKAAGFDLKSPEGAKVQQRLLKVIRRFLKKDLERLGLSNKVKLLAMFSKSKPKKGKVNESMHSLEESYLDFFSNYMLEGIINELQNQ